jgi:hypothetical protein
MHFSILWLMLLQKLECPPVPHFLTCLPSPQLLAYHVGSSFLIGVLLIEMAVFVVETLVMAGFEQFKT